TGFYAGIQGGYGWGESNWNFVGIDTSPDGWLIGGTLGYNWQAGSLVFGVEADVAWSDIKGDAACGPFVCETANSWLGTARLRLGYAFDRFMPYITGGAAFGDVEATVVGLGNASETRFGWTAGAGLEYAFAGNWT